MPSGNESEIFTVVLEISFPLWGVPGQGSVISKLKPCDQTFKNIERNTIYTKVSSCYRIGVLGHRHLEYKFGTVPAIKVQSLHVMASTMQERVHCFLLWGDK